MKDRKKSSRLGFLFIRFLTNTPPVEKDPRDLDSAHTTEKEVDRSKAIVILSAAVTQRWGNAHEDEQDIARFDDHTPPSPDGPGGHKSSVLGKRQFLGWSIEVGDTSNDYTPLHILYRVSMFNFLA